MNVISELFSPPYYAVIFTSIKNEDTHGYMEMAVKMEQLARSQEGYLGMDSAREKTGITVSYWSNLNAIKRWKINAEHLIAQSKGKHFWYESYSVRIAKVEREYHHF